MTVIDTVQEAFDECETLVMCGKEDCYAMINVGSPSHGTRVECLGCGSTLQLKFEVIDHE